MLEIEPIYPSDKGIKLNKFEPEKYIYKNESSSLYAGYSDLNLL